jgi:hypothetical protein
MMHEDDSTRIQKITINLRQPDRHTLNEDSPYSSYNLDHLGLVAGMVDELGLPELIDTVIKQDHEQRQVSVGLCVKAMILNGLGFVNRALYLMPHFSRINRSNVYWVKA